MLTRTALLAIALTLLLSLTAELRAAPPGHNPNVPELAPLEHFRGKWSGPVENSDKTNRNNSQWILQGRVMQTLFDAGGELEGQIQRTWDTAGKRYVVTLFDSSGTVYMGTGQWNESLREMTATGPLGEDTLKLTNRYLNEETEEWNITITRPDGSIRLDVSGTNHRQSE